MTQILFLLIMATGAGLIIWGISPWLSRIARHRTARLRKEEKERKAEAKAALEHERKRDLILADKGVHPSGAHLRQEGYEEGVERGVGTHKCTSATSTSRFHRHRDAVFGLALLVAVSLAAFGAYRAYGWATQFASGVKSSAGSLIGRVKQHATEATKAGAETVDRARQAVGDKIDSTDQKVDHDAKEAEARRAEADQRAVAAACEQFSVTEDRLPALPTIPASLRDRLTVKGHLETLVPAALRCGDPKSLESARTWLAHFKADRGLVGIIQAFERKLRA
jgi:hypothetical protein